MVTRLAGKFLLLALGGALAVTALVGWQMATATHEGKNTAVIVAGRSCSGSSSIGDGCQATMGRLVAPFGVSLDRLSNLYVADVGDHRIRLIKPGWDEVVNGHSDEIISTVAGTGVAGFSGDGGPATDAQLSSPEGVFVHKATGAVYIADEENHRVRKVEPGTGGVVDGHPDDIITTVAGNGNAGACVAGPATSSPLGDVESVHVDNAGNLYIAHVANIGNPAHPTSFICKVDTAGNISTIAGYSCELTDPTFETNVPATSACLVEVEGITLDRLGNIYFTEHAINNVPSVLRRIDLSGTLTTVATGTLLFGLSADRLGRVFVADYLLNVKMYDPLDSSFTTVAGADPTDFLNCERYVTLQILDHVPGDPVANSFCPESLYDVAIDQTGDVFLANQGVNGDLPTVWRVESLAEPCPDLNRDGSVLLGDILEVIVHQGDTPFVDGNSDGQEGWTALRDISRNHIIDQADIDAVLAAYGKACWY